MSGVFISYSRDDKAFAQRLTNSLQNNSIDVWIDFLSIPAGEKWSDGIQRGLDSCHAMVVIITPSAMDSTYVKAEWQYFLSNNKRIVPVLLQDTKINFLLGHIQYIDFFSEPYEDAIKKLIISLNGDTLAPEDFVPMPQQQSTEVAVPRLYGTLRVALPDGHLQLVPVNQTPFVVGRDPEQCDLVIEDTVVSRRHMVIERQAKDTYTIMDFGSTNGTRVNDTLLTPNEPVPLKYHDAIRIMEIELELRSALPVTDRVEIMRPPFTPEIVLEKTEQRPPGNTQQLDRYFGHLRARRQGKIIAKNVVKERFFIIGSAPSSHMVIKAPGVAAQHAVIYADHDGLVIEVFEDKHHVAVDGVKLPPMTKKPLTNGTIVRLGEDTDLEIL